MGKHLRSRGQSKRQSFELVHDSPRKESQPLSRGPVDGYLEVRILQVDRGKEVALSYGGKDRGHCLHTMSWSSGYDICLPSRRARVRIPGGAVALWANATFTLWSLFTQGLNWEVNVSLKVGTALDEKTTGENDVVIQLSENTQAPIEDAQRIDEAEDVSFSVSCKVE